MRLFVFLLAIVGIPCGISLSFHKPILGIVLTVLQVPNLVRGILCLTSPSKYKW